MKAPIAQCSICGTAYVLRVLPSAAGIGIVHRYVLAPDCRHPRKAGTQRPTLRRDRTGTLTGAVLDLVDVDEMRDRPVLKIIEGGAR